MTIKGMGFLFLSSIICTIAAAQSTPPRKAPPRKDTPAIAKAANGSVVSIVMSDKDGKPVAQGSGFFVSKDGLIVTNYHVIAEGNSAVVKLPDGAFYLVDGVLGSDKDRDIAVIKAHGQNFRVLALGNSNRVQVGEEVVAIGNPFFLESTVSNGIVSAIREIREEGGKFLQITAPISPGSSGGPLFNMAGEVIGITRMRIRGGENLNFAIPINDARRLMGDYARNSAKLQPLPNEPLNNSEDSKPEKRESSWLSPERFDTPAFSARYPRRRPDDPEVNCKVRDYKTFASTQCSQQTENGGVDARVMYSDWPYETTKDILTEELHDAIYSSLVNPIDISTDQFASISQDQSFTNLPPITALESTTKGMFNGAPVKVCMRKGRQGRRRWMLIVKLADSTGHTKQDCDAFFDSVVIK